MYIVVVKLKKNASRLGSCTVFLSVRNLCQVATTQSQQVAIKKTRCPSCSAPVS